MRIDWTTQYIKIAQWTHSIMIQPFLVLSDEENKDLSRSIKTDAWYFNLRFKNTKIIEVYRYFYNSFGIIDEFESNLEKAKQNININLERIRMIDQQCYDKTRFWKR